MNTGVIGIHADGTAPGASRDITVRNAQQIGGGYALSVNDADACKRLWDAGVTPIYRLKDARFDDDNAHQHFSAEAYIRLCDYNLRMAGAPQETVINWNNEPGNQDLAVLKRELRLAIETARSLNRILVVLNIAYRNWTISDWDYLAEELALIKRYGFFVGVHEGYKSPEFPDLNSAFKECIGRFIESMLKYGFKVIVTEFAASLKPDYGWSAWLTVEQWIALLRAAVAFVYEPYGIPICVFTLYEWAHDFEYVNAETLKHGMALINQEFTLSPQLPPVIVEPPMAIVNMRDKVCPITSPVRKLNSGEIVQTYWTGGFGYQGKNSQWEQFCVKSFNGVDWLCRLMDISNFLSDQKTVYALFEDEALTKPGGKWCPVNAEIGAVYERRVWVQVYDLAGNALRTHPNTGWDTTYFKIAAYHNTWTTFEGVQVTGVVECIYGHNRADIVIGTNVKERYFYSGGLVGFIDYNFNPPKQTVVTREQPTALPVQIKLPWWNPVLIPPAPTYPPPESLGDLMPGVVKMVAANWINIRSIPSASASKVGELRAGDAVQYREPVIEAGAYSTSEGTRNIWRSVSNGWVAAELLVIAPALQDLPTVSLEVPFVSQIDTESSWRNNDCGVSCASMLLRYRFKQAGLNIPRLLTVNKLAVDTPLSTADKPLALSAIETLLDGYGVDVAVQRPLTPDAILRELEAGRPPILLVNYKHINPAQKTDMGHYIVVYAAGEQSFWFHDPYLLGANIYISREQLDLAMTDLGVFASFDYQGIALAA